MLNTQSRTADKGWSSSLGVGQWAKIFTVKSSLLRNITQGLRIEAGSCEHGNRPSGSMKGG